MTGVDNRVNTGTSSIYRDAIWRAIVQTLGDFSALQRKVFVLYHYTGSSVTAIAGRTGLSEEKILAIIDQTDRLLMHRLQQLRGDGQQVEAMGLPKVRLAAG